MVLLKIYYFQVNAVCRKGIVPKKFLVMIEAFKEGIGRGNIIATIYNYEVPPLFNDIILFECLILKNLEECLSERFK